MKKAYQFSLSLMAILVASAIFISASLAPCPYTIRNTLDCPVTVDITVYSTPPANCTAICSQIAGGTIGQNSTYSIQCCGDDCNIVVTVTHLNNSPITQVPVDFSSGPQSLPSGPPPCNASAIS